MKKVLWLIVCLMTMVIFTSCSSDDEIILGSNSIKGEWYDSENNMIYFFYDNIVILQSKNGSYRITYQFTLAKNEIIFTETSTEDYSYTIEYYENKISEIRKELENARGSRRQQLIDNLNECTSSLRQAKSNQKNRTYNYYGSIISKSSNELIFTIEGETYKLHRI